MKKEHLILSIKDSLSLYYKELFQEASKESGSFEFFIENLVEMIPLQKTKTKLGETWIRVNIAPKPEFINGGSIIYSLNTGQFAFLYSFELGANGRFDSFVSNIPNFEEALNNIQKSYERFQESRVNKDSKMLPADMNLNDMLMYAMLVKSSNTPTSTAKNALFLELFLNTSMTVYEYDGQEPSLNHFVEEAYIIMASPVLKCYSSKKDYGKKTKGQLTSMANYFLVEHLEAILQSDRTQLKEDFYDFNMEGVFKIIKTRFNSLLNGFEAEFFKKE